VLSAASRQPTRSAAPFGIRFGSAEVGFATSPPLLPITRATRAACARTNGKEGL